MGVQERQWAESEDLDFVPTLPFDLKEGANGTLSGTQFPHLANKEQMWSSSSSLTHMETDLETHVLPCLASSCV